MRAAVSNERIRVLWLIKGLGPGGAERLLVGAAAVRDRDTFDYHAAYLLPWKNALVPELEHVGVPVQCLDVRNERDLRWAGRLRQLLITGQFDILHVQSPYAAGVARLVAHSLPSRVRPALVATEHNGWSTFTAPTRVMNGATLPLSDAVITVSSHVERSLWKPLRGRAETIVHGVSIADVRATLAEREATRAELSVASDEVLVGTVANYTEQKDWPNLLRAARLLADTTPRVKFCAVGQGPLETEVQALHRELSLGDSVFLPGYRPDAVRLMAACDMFALASRFEGLPVALMEALALGLPVVATAVGGVPEAVTDGVEAVLVPPERPDRFATAIADLAADPTRRAAMANAARERGAAFDITRAVRRIEEIYRELAARRSEAR
jgi:L-malate glycosyltransferase